MMSLRIFQLSKFLLLLASHYTFIECHMNRKCVDAAVYANSILVSFDV